MQRAIRTTNGWVLCPKCGHKLAKATGSTTNTEESGNGENRAKYEGKLEIKCSSCKEIIEINMEVLR